MQSGAFLGYPIPLTPGEPLLSSPPLPLKGHKPFLGDVCWMLGAGTGSSVQPGCLLHSWGFLRILWGDWLGHRDHAELEGFWHSPVPPVMSGGWARGCRVGGWTPPPS